MSSLLKKLALALAGVLVVAVGMILLVPRFVDWNRVGKLAAERATRALGREVSLSGLRVSLFSGIQIEGFKIGSRPGFSATPLVQAERMAAKYRFLPLLRLKIVIDRVELTEPSLYIERDRKGKFSFSDLYSSGPEKMEGPGSEGEPLKLPVEVAVNEIEVVGGRLGFRDVSAKPPSALSIEDFDLEIRNLTLSGAPAWLRASGLVKSGAMELPVNLHGGFSLDLDGSSVSLLDCKAEIPGIEAAAEGEITELRKNPRIKLKQRLELDLAAVWKTIRSLSGDRLSGIAEPGGKISISADLAGTAADISIAGEASFSRVTLRRGDEPALLENLEGRVNFGRGKLTGPDLRFIALGNPFSLQFEIIEPELSRLADFDPKRLAPQCSATLTSPRVKLDGLIPDTREADRGEAGRENGEIQEKEPDLRKMVPAGLVLSLDARFDQVIFRNLEMRDQRVKLNLKEGRLSVHQDFESCSGRFAVSGEADLKTYPIRHLVSARIERVEAGALADAAADSFLSKKEAGAIKGRLQGKGNLRVEAKGKGVTFGALKGQMEGAGRLWITEGAIIRPDLMARIGRLLKQDWLARDFEFKTLGGDFTFDKAKLNTPGFAMDPGPAGDLHAIYSGTIDFDMVLKGNLVTKFHPRHTDALMRGDLGQLQFSRDSEGYAIGEWEVKGPVSRPTVLPSTKNLKKKATEKATEAAKEEVKQALPELEEKGKELLKKLFGK